MSEQPIENNLITKSAWQYFVECITSKYCSFKGRANRKEFWSFILFHFLLGIVFSLLIFSVIHNPVHKNILNILWGLAFLLPLWGVIVRRLHDVNLSGWVFFSPIIVMFILVFYSVFNTIITGSSIEPSFAKSIIYLLGGIFVIVAFLTVFISTFIRGKKPENKYGLIPQETENHWVGVMLGVVIPYVVIIFGVFSLGAIAGYSKAMHKYKAAKTVDQITFTAQNINTLFQNDFNYAKIDDQTLINAHVVPEDVIDKNSSTPSFVNLYDGKVEIKVGDKEMPNDQKAFTVKYTNIPQQDCVALVSAIQVWQNSAPRFITMVATDDEERAEVLASSTLNNCVNLLQPGTLAVCNGSYQSISPEQAMEACNSNSNTLMFKFY